MLMVITSTLKKTRGHECLRPLVDLVDSFKINCLDGGHVGSAYQTVLSETTRTLLSCSMYNPAMNKRARKRLKEAIEKKNLERQKMLKEQSSASSQTKERRGFTVKPEKKRG